MQVNHQYLEDIIYKSSPKVDMFWQQRLLRKHKDLEEFKARLMICIGYYHEKYCDYIIEELRERDMLKHYLKVE